MALNDINVTVASDATPAELAKLNEENARKNLNKGTGLDDQPVVEHKVADTKADAPKVTSPTKSTSGK